MNKLTKNTHVLRFIDESMNLCKPDNVVWIDGSDEQLANLREQAQQSGEIIKLNEELLPGCWLHNSDVNDVARVEDRTFICSSRKDDAGPTNNWMEPNQAYSMLTKLFDGCMKGRTMYVIPFSMGPIGSKFSKIGIEITDSIYVVLNMAIMTRIGKACFDVLGDNNDFVRGLHSKAKLEPANRYICHFPEDNTIWSINSGYGGNALLGKKCFALRIASAQGKKEGWLAEHMLILGIQRPKTKETLYIAAAFPSQCGKTNLAMLIPPEIYTKKGYKVWCVGDDIAWLRVGEDGRLYAINPENGFFGVAPGTNEKSNPNAMATIKHDTIFTNVVHNLDNNTVWWEDMDKSPPTNARDWKGNSWNGQTATTVGAHANSRFTASAKNCPTLSPEFENANGVPISAIVFGGRRAKTTPLVYQAFDWNHGVFVGATMASETTAAQAGAIGIVRRDPMAMLPFIGYHAGDYFSHWLDIGKKMKQPPKIFNINFFKLNNYGKFAWPGFGENLRILDWILDRCENEIDAQSSSIGYMPHAKDINIDGLDLEVSDIEKLLEFDIELWNKESNNIQEFFELIDDKENKLPVELKTELENLKRRLK